MSSTVHDIEAMELERKRVNHKTRTRAINRLRRLNTTMGQYSRHIVAKFVDDEAVSVERFRLLVVLAGFPVNALFAQEDGKAVPCKTKAEIAERMKRVDGVGEMGGVVGSGGKGVGGSESSSESGYEADNDKDDTGKSKSKNKRQAKKKTSSSKTPHPVPHTTKNNYLAKQIEEMFGWFEGPKEELEEIHKITTKPLIQKTQRLWGFLPDVPEKKNIPISITDEQYEVFKYGAKGTFYFLLLIIVNRLLFRLPSKTLSFLLFGPSSKRPPALAYDDIRALPLRPGWEMRETTKGKIYFFHKPSKRVDRRIPVLSDEVPHNWVEWIVPKTNESEYENLQTGITLEGDDAYDAVQDDITNGELKRGWTESVDTKDRHHWHPPAQSPYKAESYSDRPLDKPRLEKKYGVMAWEHWASKRRGYASGEVRYQFLRDADTDLYFDTLPDVEREHGRRARGEGTPAYTPAAPAPAATATAKSTPPLPKSKSAENMADVQHEMDQLFTFTNVFALRVALAAGAGALALPFALRKYAKFIDNRAFAKVLEAPEGKPVAVARDLRVPTQTAYQNTLTHIDDELHLKFLECGDDVGMLRDRLLRMRKAREAFHQRRLLPYHLIRTNGEVRESPNEIARAIAHHWQWGNLLGIVTTRTRTAFRRTFGKRPAAATQKKRIAASASSASRRSGSQRRSSSTSASRRPSAAARAASARRRSTIGGGRRLSRRVVRR